jgi:uncharacterized protein (TIGR02996 family)
MWPRHAECSSDRRNLDVTDHLSLLAAVRANMSDDDVRLVYADWLEEHNESDRSAYLRLQVQLVREWWYDRPCTELYTTLTDLAQRIDPAWLAAVRRCTTPAPPVNIEEAIPSLRGKAKTAVRLHPRPGEAPIEASKIGGMFLWPKKEPWPVCTVHGNIPYVTALQLRKEDVPELGFPDDTDLFQLLWCPVQHEEDNLYCPKPAIFWRKRLTVTQPRETAPDRPAVQFGHFPNACVLYPDRVREYPDEDEVGPADDAHQSSALTSLEQSALATLRRLELPGSHSHPRTPSGLYQSCLSTSEGSKVGGYPEWIQYPSYPRCDCGAEMEHLLSFGSWEWSRDSWGRWVPIEDRPLLSLPHLEDSIAWAHGCMFGDAGQMYVFVCRKHAVPRIRASMQCG